LSTTTTMGSRWPAEKALTWLGLSLEKPAGVGWVAAPAVPPAAAEKDIASPTAPVTAHNRAVLMTSPNLSEIVSECPLMSGSALDLSDGDHQKQWAVL